MNEQLQSAEHASKLYNELASWWPLLSAPADYAEEARNFSRLLVEACDPSPRTIVEFGSGGGNNASHLKARFEMTLVDRSPAMLAVSRALNPECEHFEGDMLTARLGRIFDAVFIHDAIMYMTTESDLRSAIETAYVHCSAGGVALFAPDCVRETFTPSTEHGGHDGEQRAMRYLEWCHDPDPSDNTYLVEYVCLLREASGKVRVEHEQHIEGLFSPNVWLRLLSDVGFDPKIEADSYGRELFVAMKRPKS